MSYVTTYDKLRSIAARAAGLKREGLDEDAEELLDEIPNEALSDVAGEREWPHLDTRLVIASTGITVAGAGSGSFGGDYQYKVRYTSATGAIHLSPAAAINVSGKEHITVSGWPTSAGTVSIYRTTDGGKALKLVTDDLAVSTHTTYDDSMADGGLGAAIAGDPADDACVLLPDDFESFRRDDQLNYATASGYGPPTWKGIDWIRRRRARGTQHNPPTAIGWGAVDPTVQQFKLELWPTPGGVYTLVGSYRRKPAAMTANDDAPDLPTALHRALKLRTQLIAREEFNQPIPGDFENRYQQAVHQAARILLTPTPDNAEPLANVNRRGAGVLPEGHNVKLDGAWETAVSA